MNAKSPASDRAPRDAVNVEDEATERGGHVAEGLTSKQRKRYSSVTMEGKLAVGGPGYEAFDLATTVGKMMAPGGTFRGLLPGEIGICVVVGTFHRDKVLRLAEISDRAWRSYVRKWEGDRMAHRCAGRGDVALFFHPETICPVPACGVALPSERKQRSAQAEAAFRTNGSSVPRIVLKRGMHQGMQRGMAALRPEVALEPSDGLGGPVSEIAARIRRERNLGLADRDVAALLNGQRIQPPEGFVGWTGYAVRVALGEAVHAA